jgi:2-oxoglutarate ferredoxin oxidoreductase subunit alpha
MIEPFAYPDKPMDRGKVLWEADLEKSNGLWARYRDVDGDGIPYRTLAGNRHPNAAYFARGTGHDETARYSENDRVWHDMLDRLKKKYQTAPRYLPEPVAKTMEGARIGVIAYGSTDPAIEEARHLLADQGLPTAYLRLRAVPFSDQVGEFIRQQERCYVVEMNRDGQMQQLLTLAYPEYATRLISIAHIDGLPLTARRVADAILAKEEN